MLVTLPSRNRQTELGQRREAYGIAAVIPVIRTNVVKTVAPLVPR